MNKIKGACLVFQSGGPTTVINASLCGVIETALRKKEITAVYGALYGIKGVLTKQFIDFTKKRKEVLTHLKTIPGAALGSARLHLERYQGVMDETYKKIEEVVKEHNIRYIFVIGGNDSMDTCDKLADFFKKIAYECYVIGVPKTIDNDLIITDHTPGYASAAKYIASTAVEIYQDLDTYDTGRVTILEVMGRDAGWLTASVALASKKGMGPDLIYLPEVPFDVESFISDVEKIYKKKRRVYIAVSEGIKDLQGEYFLLKRNYNNDDDFGHLQLGGVGMVLAQTIKQRLNYPVRSVELNIPQRCAMHLASKMDLKEAYLCGKNAVLKALKQETGKTIVMKRVDEYKIKYETVPTSEIANKVKTFPLEWIKDGKFITDDFITYITPLIKGEVKIPFEDGIPSFNHFKKDHI